MRENDRIKAIEFLTTTGILVGGVAGGVELTRHLVNAAEPYLMTKFCIPIGIFTTPSGISCHELEEPVLVSLEESRREGAVLGIICAIGYNGLLLASNSGRYFCAGAYALGKTLQNQYKNK